MSFIARFKNLTKKQTKIIGGLIYSVILALITVLFMSTKITSGLENIVYDYILEGNDYINNDIVIVGIDTKTINSLSEFNSISRSDYAKVINYLTSANVKAIGIDVIFSGSQDPTSDMELVDAVKNNGNVILGFETVKGERFATDDKGNKIIKNGNFVIEDYLEEDKPFKELEEACYSLAYVNTISDNDGIIRRTDFNAKINDVNYNSFAKSIYDLYAKGNDLKIKDYDKNSYYINYHGKPESYEMISFIDILNDTEDRYKDRLNGTIVLIGAYTTGLSDDYYTSISRNKKMNGVEIHANIINSLMDDSIREDFSIAIQYILNILCVLIVSYFIFRFKFLYQTIAMLSIIVIEVLITIIFYKCNLFYPTMTIILISFIGYVIVVIANYIVEKKSKGAIVKTFKRYMAPQVVESFVKNGSKNLELTEEKRDVACLFVDIRGFTKMSGLLDANEVVEILDEYLGMCSEAVFENDGMVDKYIGDCCMALFNAPFDISDYEIKAIKAGIKIRDEGKEICAKYAKKFSEKYNENVSIGLGVGINCGVAFIGNIGSRKFRLDYTAIGDTINTASRLESNAKAGEIIINDDTYNRLKDKLIVSDNGYLALKGKGDVHTYNVISIKEDDTSEARDYSEN